jgi:hypothetical protein
MSQPCPSQTGARHPVGARYNKLEQEIELKEDIKIEQNVKPEQDVKIEDGSDVKPVQTEQHLPKLWIIASGISDWRWMSSQPAPSWEGLGLDCFGKKKAT